MIWLKALQRWLITHFLNEQQLFAGNQLSSTQRRHFLPGIIIGRDRSQYFAVDLSHVPKASRNAALANQVKLKSPWESVAYSVSWAAGWAQVWLWDKSQLESELVSITGLPAASLQRTRFIAEALYWSKPESDGVYLFACNLGSDLQFWSRGVMRASQWFAETPGLPQIQRFYRAQGLAPSKELPACLTPQIMEKPWAGLESAGFTHLLEHKAGLVILLLAVSLGIASLQLTSILSWGSVEKRWLSKTEQLQQTAADLISARNQARSAKAELNSLLTLLQQGDALEAQLKIFERLPNKNKIQLETWERTADQVSMIISGDIGDTLSLVRALERDGITNVTVEPQSQTKYRVQLVLNRYMPQQLSEAAGANTTLTPEPL
ncbi:hypothetical protein [Cellvibrio fontiphilus]|uniref:Fimbrial assembly family protein n=1 Tax=Cellvibrio fontiphilus TaxID=1815559 RepID=A0ABV7FBR1_9GAMM